MGYRAVVYQMPRLSKRQARHLACMRRTAELEREIFGEVVSLSVERAQWWPLDGEPPSISLTPPPDPDLPDCGITERR